jgi:hypothetical protein
LNTCSSERICVPISKISKVEIRYHIAKQNTTPTTHAKISGTAIKKGGKQFGKRPY